MLNQFLTYINARQLFKPHERVLLAVSGGVDSVVLAKLFFEAKFPFSIAHCNFKLRAEASESDAELVRNLALQYHVEFFENSFDVSAYCQQNGVSVQMAARKLRYEWFEEIRATHGFDYIATAHHQNDNAETLLLNLARGTGIAGFHAILPKNNWLIRPLLFATKASIEAYAHAEKLVWREDASNKSIKYQRNFIRHRVTPLLKELNPQFEANIASTIEQLSAVERVFNQKVAEVRKEAVVEREHHTEILFEALRPLSEPIIILSAILKPYGFDYQWSKKIWTSADSSLSKRFMSESHVLFKERSSFVIRERGTVDTNISDEPTLVWPHSKIVGMTVNSFSTDELPIEQIKFGDKNELFADLDSLEFPLVLRKWQPGDWFCPFGMGGKRKKVSDFLIDCKYPVSQKDQVRVLLSNNTVVWLVGFRADERFRLSPKTCNVLKISI